MEFKLDWEQAQKRMLAWWEQEILDRPCLQVSAPRPGQEQVLLDAAIRPQWMSLERWWTDTDAALERGERRLQATYFAGEAFPLFNPNLGPDLFSAFLGAEVRLQDEDTNWVEPLITDWATAPELRLHRDSYWYKLQLRLLRQAQEAGRGRWITGLPDTHAGGDAFSALRGRKNACLDLYDHPDEVRRALSQIDVAMKQVYDDYLSILEPERWGSSSGWLPAWYSGKANALQCDFIALVSPAHMREFILPSIIAEARCLDRGIFHLDGPGSMRHLDALLETPEIHAIQWVYGAGNEPATRWVPLMRRIQAAGKSVWVSATPEEVETLYTYLRPEGLMVNTWASSAQEADDLVALVAGLAGAH